MQMRATEQARIGTRHRRENEVGLALELPCAAANLGQRHSPKRDLRRFRIEDALRQQARGHLCADHQDRRGLLPFVQPVQPTHRQHWPQQRHDIAPAELERRVQLGRRPLDRCHRQPLDRIHRQGSLSQPVLPRSMPEVNRHDARLWPA